VPAYRVRHNAEVSRCGFQTKAEAEADANLPSNAFIAIWSASTDRRLLPYVYKTQQRLRASTRFRELRINCLQFQIRRRLIATGDVGAARKRGKEPVSEARRMSKPR
jgi:hypothetical protein